MTPCQFGHAEEPLASGYSWLGDRVQLSENSRQSRRTIRSRMVQPANSRVFTRFRDWARHEHGWDGDGPTSSGLDVQRYVVHTLSLPQLPGQSNCVTIRTVRFRATPDALFSQTAHVLLRPACARARRAPLVGVRGHRWCEKLAVKNSLSIRSRGRAPGHWEYAASTPLLTTRNLWRAQRTAPTRVWQSANSCVFARFSGVCPTWARQRW